MSAIVDALKPKKAKKKAGGVAPKPSEAEGVKPPPSKEPAPETPVTPATGAATPQVVEEEGVGKSKGPVEEVIAKRARQLAKKLVSDPSWSGGGKLSERGSQDDADGANGVDRAERRSNASGLTLLNPPRPSMPIRGRRLLRFLYWRAHTTSFRT
jgi:hypothetical protein